MKGIRSLATGLTLCALLTQCATPNPYTPSMGETVRLTKQYFKSGDEDVPEEKAIARHWGEYILKQRAQGKLQTNEKQFLRSFTQETGYDINSLDAEQTAELGYAGERYFSR